METVSGARLVTSCMDREGVEAISNLEIKFLTLLYIYLSCSFEGENESKYGRRGHQR